MRLFYSQLVSRDALCRDNSYARTPDKKVEASVNALSAWVNSPKRGGPAGCASILSFDTRSPAPRSSFFFFLTAVGFVDGRFVTGAFPASGFAAGDFVAGGMLTIV